MMLIARNRIHPRELTHLPYETCTTEIRGWSPLSLPAGIEPAIRILDTDHLARVLGAAAISKASPQLVHTATDQVIGGVAPTGHPSRLRTVVNETLASYPLNWTAAGNADSVMPLTYEQLLTLTKGVPVAVSAR